jgi:alpha-glucosidase (family GH31 glycosyl hydrolase)
VIGVKLDHFVHTPPSTVIALFPDAQAIPNSTLTTTESGHSIVSGGLTAEITTNPYTITFKSPTRTLTFAGPKYQAIYDVPSRWTTQSASNSSCLALDSSSNPTPAPLPEFVRYINSELNISPGELVYGFGEQFGAFVKNGQWVQLFKTVSHCSKVNQSRCGTKASLSFLFPGDS